MLALVRVRRAGCPARESVAALRGRSCRCGAVLFLLLHCSLVSFSRDSKSLHFLCLIFRDIRYIFRAMVCVVMCARNRVELFGLSRRYSRWGELRAYMTFPYPYDHTARGREGPHMHTRPRHSPTDTPARFSTAKPLSTVPRSTRSRQRCASTGPSIRSFMRLRRACSSWWQT